MSFRNYTLLALVVFLAVCSATYYTEIVPVPPVAFILFTALILIAFQLEDGKLARILGELNRAFHDDLAHRGHH